MPNIFTATYLFYHFWYSFYEFPTWSFYAWGIFDTLFLLFSFDAIHMLKYIILFDITSFRMLFIYDFSQFTGHCLSNIFIIIAHILTFSPIHLCEIVSYFCVTELAYCFSFFSCSLYISTFSIGNLKGYLFIFCFSNTSLCNTTFLLIFLIALSYCPWYDAFYRYFIPLPCIIDKPRQYTMNT